LGEEGDLPPLPSAVGRPPPAVAGVEGSGEGGVCGSGAVAWGRLGSDPETARFSPPTNNFIGLKKYLKYIFIKLE
jgi:hypothetical protein